MPATHILRALLRFTALIVSSAVLLPVCLLIAILAPLFGPRLHYRAVMFVTRWFTGYFGMLCGLRVKTEGTRHPAAAVFIGNHFSYLDILVVGSAVGSVFIAQHGIRHWPVIGWFARLAGTVFINRSSVRSASASANIIKTRAGYGVRMAFFPEGGIKTTEGELGPFTAFLFGPVAESQLVVQPVAIGYAFIGKQRVTAQNFRQVYWCDHTPFMRHGFRALGLPSIRVVVRFLNPAAPPPLGSGKDALRAYAAGLRSQVQQGLGQYMIGGRGIGVRE